MTLQMMTEEKTPEFEEENGIDTACGTDSDEDTEAAEEIKTETAETEAAEEDAAAEDESGTADDAESDAGEGRIKGRFGRKEKKELAKKEAELAELKDKYMRTLAEYENFRKRTEKEKADIYSYAVRDVMEKMLPVLDNLERGVAAVPEESKDDPFALGMEKILRQFEKSLDDIGVKPIDAAGKEFDPKLHNAVMHVDDEAFGANIVAEELMKGYTYKDTVVRHSMVKVAN